MKHRSRYTQSIGLVFVLLIPLCLLSLCCVTCEPGKSKDQTANGPQQIPEPTITPNQNQESKMSEKDQLTKEEGIYLIKLAKKTIEQELFSRKDQGLAEPSVSSAKFSEPRGTFVTLTIDHDLRGCIGHIVPQESLLEGVKENAINAAFRDPRFPPLSKSEFGKIKIEVSILTEPKDLAYQGANDLLNKIRPGIDGLIIKKGFYQATFLPQVWDQLPDKKEFLSHLCMKAGLDEDEWQKGKLEVQTYQVQAFEEE